MCKQTMKRVISMLLVVVLLVGMMPELHVHAWWSGDSGGIDPEQDTTAVVNSGSCGENLTFELKESGNLYISGNGPMEDYAAGTAPWSAYAGENTTYVYFDSGVTSIGDNAFYNCFSLKKVSFPDTLTEIGDFAFFQAAELCSIVLPEGLTTIGANAFAMCGYPGLDGYDFISVTLPSTIRTIGDGAFTWCGRLQNINFPEGLETIGRNAFNGCYNLRTVELPDSVTSLGEGVFLNCHLLRNLRLPDNLEVLPKDMFSSIDTTKVSMTKITLPKNLKRIESSALVGDDLKDIYIPGNVETISGTAFGNSKVTVHFSGDAPSFGEGFFDTGLTVCYPENNATWNDLVGQGTATWVPVVTGTCGDNLTWTLDENGVLTISGTGDMDDYDTGYYSPFYPYREQITRVVMSEGITTVGKYAFQQKYPNLEYVQIPMSVTIIHDYAFGTTSDFVKLKYAGTMEQWKGMQYVGKFFYDCWFGAECTDGTIDYWGRCGDAANFELYPDGTLKIYGTGAMKFYQYLNYESYWSGDEEIRNVEIGEGITSIAGYAFMNCANLKSVSIPLSMKVIDYDAFGGSGLTDVYYGGSEKTWDAISIADDNNDPLFAANIHFTDLCAEGHDLESHEAQAPTCSAVGWEAYETCTRCYYTTYVEIPTNDSHSYNAVVTAPTCVEDGYTTYTCSLCGDSYVADVVPANGTHTGEMGEYCADCGLFICYTGSEKKISWILDEHGVFTLSGSGDYSNATWARYANKIKKVVISEGITYVASGAFQDCVNLTQVTLPETVTVISGSAFNGCAALETINIHEGVTVIGAYAFIGCKVLKEIRLPAGLTKLGYNAFQNCEFLEAVRIPAGVETIEGEVFKGCAQLKTVEIADGIYKIEGGAFADCTDLESIVIPESVWYFGTYVFNGCTSLKSVNIPADVTEISQGLFYGCSNLETLTLPEGVTQIGYSAFDGCASLTALELPAGVTEIGGSAFQGCNSLTEIHIPAGVTVIADKTFQYCSALATVTLPEGLSTIGASAFDVCRALTEIQIPDGVTEIGAYAFAYCSSLSQVKLPESLTSIGKSAFYDCMALREIYIPAGMTVIDGLAFSHCTNLDILVFEGDAPSFAEDAFYYSCVTAYYPADNETWTDDVLQTYGAKSIQWVPYWKAGDSAWAYLKDGTLTVTGSGGTYFFGDSTEQPWYAKRAAVKAIVVEPGITGISTNSLCGFKLATSITLPDGLRIIGGGAFAECERVTQLDIPDSVIEIGPSAFSGCSSIKKLVIPAGVTVIEPGVFAYCSSLEEVELLGKIKEIGNHAFVGTQSLKGITLPEGLTAIRYGAFEGSGLEEIVLPNTVNVLADQVFQNCEALHTVTLPARLLTVEHNTFAGTKSLKTITLPESLITIGIDAFAGSGLEQITIPDSVVDIGEGVFRGCESLHTVILPQGLTAIESGVFYNCTALRTVWIPAEVTAIGSDAFSYCTALEFLVFEGDALTFSENSFDRAVINAFYPADNETWTEDVRQTYGAKSIQWVPYWSCGDNAWAYLKDGTLTVTGSGAMTDYDYINQPAPWHSHRREIGSVVVEQGITELGDAVFAEFDMLTAVSLPDGLTRIGENAFYGCEILEQIALPNTLTTIDSGAFHQCCSLQSITIPAGVTQISERAFAWCTDLEIVNLPDTIEVIGDSAFSYCYALKQIQLWDGVTTIGASAFEFCESLEEMHLPETVTTIGGYAFGRCRSLREINIPSRVTVIEEYAFCDCSSLKTVILPENLARIGNCAFAGCSINLAFIGDAPVIRDNAFVSATIIAFYPADNATWTEDKRQTYGASSIQWVPYWSCGDSAWAYLKDNTLTITGSGEMEIPVDQDCVPWLNHKLEIRSVVVEPGITYLANYSFYDCGLLSSVTLPEGLLKIGHDVFYCCENLKEIQIPASVTEIGSDTFAGTGLRQVELPNGMTQVSGHLFGECQYLETVVLPDTITAIASRAFEDCAKLSQISMPAALTSIGEDAFAFCYALTEVTLPVGVTQIGARAFRCCTGLKTINIPEGVEVLEETFYGCAALEIVLLPKSLILLGNDTFGDCQNLTVKFLGDAPVIQGMAFNSSNMTVKYPGDNATWTEDMLQNYGGTITWVPYCSGIHVYEAVVTAPTCVEDGYTTYTCSLCGESYVADIVPANGAHTGEMGEYCAECGLFICYTGSENDVTWTLDEHGVFTLSGSGYYSNATWARYANKIKKVVISEGITYVTNSAFKDCVNLTQVTLPETVTGINGYAFHGCSALETINLPDGLTTIDASAFCDCKVLKEISLPAGLTGLRYDAFKNCVSLEAVRIPAGVETIAGSLFSGCTQLKTVEIEDGIYKIEGYAFNGCTALEIIAIPESVWYLESGVFNGCTSLKSVNIPADVTEISYSLFSDCSSLETLTLPEGITKIGECAFDGCASLTALELPAGVTEIGGSAFQGCSSLTAIHIPAGVTVIADKTFQYCSALATVTLPEGLITIGASAFDVCRALTEIHIPDGVTAIGKNAFSFCSSMTAAILPDSITTIGGSAFYDCSSLTEIKIPAGMTELAKDLFHGCSALATVTLPEGLRVIGDNAFWDCDALREIVIPATVTSIGKEAFFGIQVIDAVTFRGNAPAFASDCFKANSSVTVYYPHGYEGWEETINSNYGANRVTWIPYCLNEHCYEAVVTEPTCTEDGYTTYTCSVCGESYVDDPVDALGHAMGAWYTVTEPSCVAVGESRRDCVRCDHYETEEIPAVGHTYEAVVTEPTCTEDGYTTYTCSICGESYMDNPVEALGHAMGAWYTVTEPSCVAVGESRRDCVRCDHYETEEIPAVGHTYEAVVTEPTCTEDGYTTYTCSVCGESYVDDPVEALGHEMGAWYTVTEPSCVAVGESRRDCVRCDHYETEEIPAVGHTYEAVVTEPTCTEDGYTTYTCSVCGESYMDDPVEALGHAMGAWYTVTEPSCTEAGESYRACIRCAYFETEEIPVVDHTYEAVVTEPNCTEEGYTTYTCSACGDSYVDDFVPVNGIHVGDMGEYCTNCGEFIPYTGICGENLTWVVDLNGVLTISGTGPMPDFAPADVPWGELNNQIQRVVIDDGITTIGSYALAYLTNMTSVEIPGSVTRIGENAFFGSTGLTEVVIPEGVTELASCAFAECYGLTSVTLPDSLEIIGASAFCFCTSLPEITIPAGVTTIGTYAFGGCGELRTIDFEGDAPSIGYNAFDGLYLTAYYPASNATWTEDVRQQYCGNVVWLPKGEIVFTTQPQIHYGRVGTVATFAVATSMDNGNVTYQWQYSTDYGRSWKDYTGEGFDTKQISLTVTSGNMETMYRCVVTDHTSGKTGVSEWTQIRTQMVDSGIASGFDTVNRPFDIQWVLTQNGSLFITGTGRVPCTYEFYGEQTTNYNVYKEWIKSVIVLPGVSAINGEAFYQYSNLTRVNIADTVTEISVNAFGECPALVNITLPQSLTVLGSYAFAGSAITHIDLPESLTAIGNHAFERCLKLKEITLGNNITTVGAYAFNWCQSLETIVMGDQLTTLGEEAFGNCPNVKDIRWSENLEKIGDRAFVCMDNGSNDFTELVLPDSVKTIGARAFDGWNNLEVLHLPKQLTSIGMDAFAGSAKLRVIEMPEMLTQINDAFCNHPLVEEIRIPASVILIGNSAFKGYTGLKKIVFEGDPPLIANQAFTNVTADAYYPVDLGTWTEEDLVSYKGDLTWIPYCLGGHAYEKEEVVAPTCTEDGYILHTCTRCGDSYKDNPVDALGHEMGQWYTVTEPTCTEAGEKRRDCDRCDHFDTRVTVAAGHEYETVVTEPTCTEGGYTTDTCTVCGDVRVRDLIPATGHTADWGEYCGNCGEYLYYQGTRENISWILDENGTLTVSGSGAMPNFDSVDVPWGEAYDKIRSVEISKGITTIGSYAFAYIPNMTSVKIPASVTRIGRNAFFGSTGLTATVIPEGVTAIESCAFSECYGLTSVTLPKSLKTIGGGAFSYCTSLKEITIPAGVASVGGAAFQGCGALEKVTIPESVVEIETAAFAGCCSITNVYYGSGKSQWLNIDFNDDNECLTEAKIHFAVTAMPNITKLENTATGIKITWGAVDGAEKYRVFVKTSKGWATLTNTTGTSYIYTAAESGKTYTFTVRCVDAAGAFTSPFNTTGWKYTYVAQPAISKLENTASGIKITWNAVAGAGKYRVFVKNGTGWTKVADTASNSITWTGAKSGVAYTFTVRAMNKDATAFVSSYNGTGWTQTFVAQPAISKFETTAGGIKITWGAVSGAGKYRVYVKNGTGWQNIGTTAGTTLTYTGAKAGQSYTFTVRCLNSDGSAFVSTYNTTGWSHACVAQPVIAKAESTAGGLRISWSAVSGAGKYRVFVKTSKGWATLGDTTGTSFTYAAAQTGKAYRFTVRAMTADGKFFSSTYNTTGWQFTYSPAPVVTKLESTAKGIKLTWDKINGAAEYRVFVKNAKGSWTKVGDTTGTAMTYTGAKLGETYTFTVRCLDPNGTAYTSSYNTTGWSYTYSPVPEVTFLGEDITAAGSSGNFRLTWNAINGAAKYRVFIKTGSGWQKLGDTTGTSYLYPLPPAGVVCTFTVRCVSADGKTYTSDYNTTGWSVMAT